MRHAPRYASLAFCFSVLAAAAGLGAAGCGRSDLFSARRSCPAGDTTCHLGNDVDGGGPATDGGRPGTDGGGGDRVVCPTGNREICGNGHDDDCNGLADCADTACFGDPACTKPGQEVCNNGLDDDDDGLVDCADPDCMGSLACRPTMGREICDNGVDDNGDRLTDCADPQCTTFPACLTVACTADVDFGTIAAHGARVTRTLDTRGATTGFATCAPSGGTGRVGRFTLATAADVRVDFSQPAGGAHVVGLFRAGAQEACDRNPVGCVPVGQAATASRTFAGLGAGVYWLIVESFPGTQSSTTVTLSTGTVSTPEQCANGIDDDGNGLIDCQDLACRLAPNCAASQCTPDLAIGALVVGAPPQNAQIDLRTQGNRYHPTCAGTSTAGDEAIAFTLPQAGGFVVNFQQTGQTLFSLFAAPGPGLACDSTERACAFEEVRAGAIAFSELPSGRYILILKAVSPAQAGTLSLSFSAFANRQVEVCGNGIDDDGNGLIDCADPACFGVGVCTATGCTPDVDLGPISWGTVQSTTLNTTGALSLYQSSCARGDGKERIVRVTLTQPMALGIECTDTGSHVFELSQQLAPLDACNAHDVNCADPAILPFGCGYSIPGLQPGQYNLIVQAFQPGAEGIVNLTVFGEQVTVREICDNGIDDDMDGATDCADLKCVASPVCAKFACRADQTLGILPLDGSPTSVVVQTTGGGNDQTRTPCVSAPGGQDGDVDFQLSAAATVTIEWAQVGNHDFAVYPDGGMLLACDAQPAAACTPSAAQSTGSFPVTLGPGRYHLVVDADQPGKEGGVVLQISALPQ